MTHISNWVRANGGSLVLWISSTFVAGTSVFLISSYLIRLGLDYERPLDVVWVFATLGALGGLIGGLMAGFCQYLTLRRRAQWARGWVPATVLGWTLGGCLWASLSWLLDSVVSLPLATGQIAAVLIAAVALGWGQALFLTRWVSRATWWIITTLLLGLVVGFVATWALSTIFIPTPSTAFVVLVPVGILVACAIGFVSWASMSAFLSEKLPEDEYSEGT